MLHQLFRRRLQPGKFQRDGQVLALVPRDVKEGVAQQVPRLINPLVNIFRDLAQIPFGLVEGNFKEIPLLIIPDSHHRGHIRVPRFSLSVKNAVMTKISLSKYFTITTRYFRVTGVRSNSLWKTWTV